MTLGETFNLSLRVVAEYVAVKGVRVIAGRALERVVYARLMARDSSLAESTAMAAPEGLSRTQKARVLVAGSVYLSMRGHPLTWLLAVGCGVFWIIPAFVGLV